MCTKCNSHKAEAAKPVPPRPITGLAILAAFGLTAMVSGAGGPAAVQAAGKAAANPAAGPSAKVKAGKTAVKWTCPMHPHYIANEFGTCPICGMNLVKLQTSGGDGGDQSSAGAQRKIITVAPETMQSMGVRLAKVERVNFGRSIRSYGIVEENERLQEVLTARLEGWIEDLRITAVGDAVKKGDMLYSVYAPELIVSQKDYLDAMKTGNRQRRDSVNQRLRSFGVQARVIANLDKTREVAQRVPFYAEQDGTVSELHVQAGAYVKRGMTITKIQDYTKVWLVVNAAEKDLALIRRGTPARVVFPNIPGRATETTVDYIYPTINKASRTGRVRLVVDNKDGVLRPGAYADVTFEVDAAQRVAVHPEAILRSGAGSFVVASLGQGRFEPKAVTTGMRSGRWIEIVSGVGAGDSIVVSGQFLLDSESALRESFRKLERLQLPLSLIKLDVNQTAMVDHIADAAIYLHEALTDGHVIDAKFLTPAHEIKSLLWPNFKDTKLGFVLADSADAIKAAQAAQTNSALQDALARLVAAFEPWIMEGAPGHYREKKLAMFKDDASGRKWIQAAGKAVNPYGKGTFAVLELPAVPMPSKAAAAPQTAPDANAAGRGSAGMAGSGSMTPPAPNTAAGK